MSKYGTFSEPGYNSIGDPYEKKQSRDDRHGGLNFKSGSRRTGKGNDATFGKFAPLYAGEKYSQDYKEKRRARLESQKGYVQTAPFRPSNPGKESSGLGGDYGCLSKLKTMPVSAAETPLKKGDVVERPRNIVTNPSKRGTYGMIKLNIGQAAKGSVGEYTYSSDPYDLQRKKDIRERAESHKLRVTEKPFRPANPTRKGGPGVPGTTLGGAQGVIKEYEYIPPDYAKPPPVEKGLTPFVPTNPSKQGYNAPINKFPAHAAEIDPEGSEKRPKYTPAFVNSEPFRPSSTLKSAAVSSIVRMNV
eukprot:PRCOL_00004695-RA